LSKKLGGYMTIEVSFIMPMVLLLFMLIIMSALFQFKRCIVSQNDYLMDFRTKREMMISNNNGEVLYGNMDIIKTVRRLKNGS